MADYADIVGALEPFWGRLDTHQLHRIRTLHYPMFVHEFGDTALVIRGPDEAVVAYLLGFVAPATAVGYVHLIGVRDSHRRRGLGRLLYREFESRARDRGATSLKAITGPTNGAAIAFHRSLGMSATLAHDYAGPGQHRIVFSMRVD
jgi:ribosomal protein S18 acetylase RimI-like enzyme